MDLEASRSQLISKVTFLVLFGTVCARKADADNTDNNDDDNDDGDNGVCVCDVHTVRNVCSVCVYVLMLCCGFCVWRV